MRNESDSLLTPHAQQLLRQRAHAGPASGAAHRNRRRLAAAELARAAPAGRGRGAGLAESGLVIAQAAGPCDGVRQRRENLRPGPARCWHSGHGRVQQGCQPADAGADPAFPGRRKCRCCSTGCPGATPSAATTTPTWCCAQGARCTSTKDGRYRVPSTRRFNTCGPDPQARVASQRRSHLPRLPQHRSSHPRCVRRRRILLHRRCGLPGRCERSRTGHGVQWPGG